MGLILLTKDQILADYLRIDCPLLTDVVDRPTSLKKLPARKKAEPGGSASSLKSKTPTFFKTDNESSSRHFACAQTRGGNRDAHGCSRFL